MYVHVLYNSSDSGSSDVLLLENVLGLLCVLVVNSFGAEQLTHFHLHIKLGQVWVGVARRYLLVLAAKEAH